MKQQRILWLSLVTPFINQVSTCGVTIYTVWEPLPKKCKQRLGKIKIKYAQY